MRRFLMLLWLIGAILGATGVVFGFIAMVQELSLDLKVQAALVTLSGIAVMVTVHGLVKLTK